MCYNYRQSIVNRKVKFLTNDELFWWYCISHAGGNLFLASGCYFISWRDVINEAPLRWSQVFCVRHLPELFIKCSPGRLISCMFWVLAIRPRRRSPPEAVRWSDSPSDPIYLPSIGNSGRPSEASLVLIAHLSWSLPGKGLLARSSQRLENTRHYRRAQMESTK